MRKAIGSSPRRTKTPAAPIIEPPQQNIVPERPAWEVRQPLSSIGSRQRYCDDEIHNGGNLHSNLNALSPLATPKQEPLAQSPWQQFGGNDDAGYHSNPSDPSPRYGKESYMFLYKHNAYKHKRLGFGFENNRPIVLLLESPASGQTKLESSV